MCYIWLAFIFTVSEVFHISETTDYMEFEAETGKYNFFLYTWGKLFIVNNGHDGWLNCPICGPSLVVNNGQNVSSGHS